MLPDLILASASPRRRELLAGLGVRFTLRAADLDETPRPGEDPETTVLRLARAEAAGAARPRGPGRGAAGARPGEGVLPANTDVLRAGTSRAKPRDPEDARRMLARIAGREHT